MRHRCPRCPVTSRHPCEPTGSATRRPVPRGAGRGGLGALGPKGSCGGAGEGRPTPGRGHCSWSEPAPALRTSTSSSSPHLPLTLRPPQDAAPVSCSRCRSGCPPRRVPVRPPPSPPLGSLPGFGARWGAAGLASSGQVTHLPRAWAGANMAAWRGRPGGPALSPRPGGGVTVPSLRADARAVALVPAGLRTRHNFPSSHTRSGSWGWGCRRRLMRWRRSTYW